jgi:hypothetical protein
MIVNGALHCWKGHTNMNTLPAHLPAAVTMSCKANIEFVVATTGVRYEARCPYSVSNIRIPAYDGAVDETCTRPYRS